MATGACGICCDVCRLCVIGVCSTCGPGNGPEADAKMKVQRNVLGRPCSILACARMNRVDYCLRDCDQFPCALFESGPYPFAEGFLQMQNRRRTEFQNNVESMKKTFDAPPEHWEALSEKEPKTVAANALVGYENSGRYRFHFLNRELTVDVRNRVISEREGPTEKFVNDGLVALLVLVYLGNAAETMPANEPVAASGLKDALFFQGPHEIDVSALEERFGRDPNAFRTAAERLDGASIPMADFAYRFRPFPKVPLHYLLWAADDEFPARVSILFDRSIEAHLPADVIWGLTQHVTGALLSAAPSPKTADRKGNRQP